MTAKEYLSRGRRLDELIDSDVRELQRLRHLAMSITPNYEGEPVSGGEVKSRTEEIVVKICSLEERIQSEIDDYVDVQREIREAIVNVKNPNERLLLRERYIIFRSWEDIAEKMGYSVRSVYTIHGRALRKIKVPETLQ
ncbi:MAG: DUF1492 domain-containing protein [Oscillospiraceae bacterium]|nr:DUF1492 domain-containing protein [Oscillospiraceae bacterium]